MLNGSSFNLHNWRSSQIRRRFTKNEYIVDFNNVPTVGFESTTIAKAIAGLRAHEARYFMNKHNHKFTVIPASESQKAIEYVNNILKEERDIVIASKPLDTSSLELETTKWGTIKWVFVFYENGLEVNILYAVDGPKGRAVGFKLSKGLEVPKELEMFKFARGKSKLAGTIRGSYFDIKGEY